MMLLSRTWQLWGAALIAVAAALYCWGAIRQADRLNIDPTLSDQSAYLSEARQYHQDPLGYVSGRNRMPLYLLFQAAVYRPGQSDAEFFRHAIRANILLSLVLLGLLYPLLRTVLSPPATGLLIGLTGFTVWIFKAGFVQADLLFYFLALGTFLLACRALHAPTVLLGASCGVAAGLAHLTKASILPGLALYLLFAVIAAVTRLRPSSPDRSPARRQLLSAAGAAIAFVLVIAPYALTSKRIFGHYLYNVNSTFYLWYDSWEEALAGTKAHGDRRGWPDMPASAIPSPQKYFATHSPGEVARRIVRGLARTDRVRSRFGYDPYVAGLIVFVAIAAFRHRSRLRPVLRADWPVVGFGIAYFAVYLVLYGFYSPIAAGDRFVLALFLPLVVSLAAIADRTAIAEWSARVFGRNVRLWPLCLGVLAAALICELPIILGSRVVTMWGGE